MGPSRHGFLLALLVVAGCGSSEPPPPNVPPAPPPVVAPAAAAPPPAPTSSRLAYPPAPRREVIDLYRDARVVDSYQWLEDSDDPAVSQWSDAENALARQWLDAAPDREAIRARVEALVGEKTPAWSDLVARKGVVFALESRPPKQHPYLVTFASLDATNSARTVLDPDALDPSGGTAIDFFVPSTDGKLVAVSISSGGSEAGDVHVFDVATGKERTGDRITRVNGGTAGGSVAWKGDGSGFYYTRYPRVGERPGQDLGFYQQVYFHPLGDAPEHDAYALGHDGPRIAEWRLTSSEDGKTTIAAMEYGDGGEYDFWVQRGGAAWVPVAVPADRVKDVQVGADGSLYLLSFAGAAKGRVLRTSAAQPQIAHAQVVVPEGDGAIEEMRPTRTRVYVVENTGGTSRLRSVPLQRTGAPVTLATAPIASIGEVEPLGGDEVAFVSVSYTTPRAWYRADATKGTAVQKTALAGTTSADFSNVDVVRESCTSKDGTAVPLTVLHPKGVALDGHNPTILTGYGGFAINVGPSFRADRLAWLERGGVLAVANLRGGGELGEEWHKAGAMTKKQNVFDDFYACAQHLVSAKYTSKEKLAIEGGSNGGLLMGAEITQHPDAFQAVVARVGIFDMLRVERDTNGLFNTTEYGSVTKPEQFDALYAYSPYHHVEDGKAYPAALFMTGKNDPRVNPYHSRKMVARLQAATSSDAPILLRTSANTGHGMGTPLHARIEEYTDMYAFLMKELGVSASPPAAAPAASGSQATPSGR